MRDKTKDDNGLAGMPDGFNISESDIPGPDIKDIKGWTPQDYIATFRESDWKKSERKIISTSGSGSR